MGPKIEDFEILSTIGSGSHGTVRKVKRRSDGQILVWKELNYRSLSEEEKKGLVLEVNILRELRHPNIVRFLHHIVDRRSTTLYILMEYCPGGDLKTLINKCRKSRTYVEEGFIWRVLKQLTDALKACHRPHKDIGRVILHRDLKPANVFLDKDGNVKLGDFGLARTLNSESSFATTYVGTPYYMSPEVVDGREYNEQSDIWSLGCMIYELCSLHPPFQAATHEDLHKRIREARYSHIPVQYSAGLQEIISLMITYEDFLRPTALMVLHHPQLLANTSQLTELSDTQTYPNSPFTTECNTPIHDNKNVSTHIQNTSTHENKSVVSQNSKTSTYSHNSNTQNSTTPYNVTNTKTISVHSNFTNIVKEDNTHAYTSSTPISGTHTQSDVNANSNKSSTFIYNSESYKGGEYKHQHQNKQSADTSSTHIDICTLNDNALVHNPHVSNSEKTTEKNNTEDLHFKNEVFLSCRNLKISKEQIGINSEFHEEFSPFRTHTKSKSFGDTYSYSKSVGSLNNEYCKDSKETIVINNVYDQEFSPFKTHSKSDYFQKQIVEDNGKFVEGINKGARLDKVALEENNEGLFPFITHKIFRAVNEEIIPGNDFNWCKSECENNVTKDIVQKHNDSNTFAILTETVERINKEVATDNVEITFGSSEIESDLDVSIDFNNCGAKNICICGGLSTDEWQSRLAKVRETETSMRKREIAIEMSERELVKREHKVSQMEREARQHLVRAQIFLRQSRPRSSTATTQQRPASDLDTTVSADVDEMPQTTTKLDPNFIENPFLPLRGVAQVLKHNEKKNVKFKENSMTFKSNTLENPKKLKKPGLVDRGVNCKKTTCDDAAIKYLSTNTNNNITLKKDSSHSEDKHSTDNPKKVKEKTKIKQRYSNVKSKITFNKFSKKPKESMCDKENICSNNLKSKTSLKSSGSKLEVISSNVGKEKQRTVAVGSGRVLQFYKAL